MYGMVFCVVTDGKAGEITLPECDFAIFGFGILGEVDYERELKGETEKFEECARLSKNSCCANLRPSRTGASFWAYPI